MRTALSFGVERVCSCRLLLNVPCSCIIKAKSCVFWNVHIRGVVVKRVLSGVQPSGVMTLGNYLGALRPFVALQHTHECFFMIADLHAITVPQSPAVLRTNTESLVAMALACGIDPKHTVLFLQSHVLAHTQLAWTLMTMTGTGELERMTQFKDKSQEKTSVSTGLFVYPVLQAADILLYQADLVPVGDDQRQHLELTRDIGLRFNQRFGDTFNVPQAHYAQGTTRVMSLVDGRRKMSKSDPNAGAYISLLDTPDVIHKKLKRATTDSRQRIALDWEHQPEISNLLTILAACTSETVDTVVLRYAGKGYGDFKRDVAEAIVAVVEPIQQRYHTWCTSGSIPAVLAEGALRAQTVAQATCAVAMERLGFVKPSGEQDRS